MTEINPDADGMDRGPEAEPDREPEPVPVLPRRARYHEPQDEAVTEAAARSSPERQAAALANAIACARIADENRAREIELLDIRRQTPLFDYFVILTVPSRRQANAIVSEIDAEMKRRKEFKLSIEGSEEGRWTLMDYGDFVVHVLSAEAREYYALEDIWGDAARIDWREEPPASDAVPPPEPS